jgi:hypothetical protein
MLRVHHVCWCFEPENVDAVKAFWKERFETKLYDFVQPELGLRVLINWEAGVEIITPLGQGGTAGPQVRAHLDARGEGVYTVAVEVDDLPAATAQAEAAGASVTLRDEFVVGKGDGALEILQMVLSDVLGMRLTLQHATPSPR